MLNPKDTSWYDDEDRFSEEEDDDLGQTPDITDRRSGNDDDWSDEDDLNDFDADDDSNTDYEDEDDDLLDE